MFRHAPRPRRSLCAAVAGLAVVVGATACPVTTDPDPAPAPVAPGTLVRSELAFDASPEVDAAAAAALVESHYAVADDLLGQQDQSTNQALSPTSILMAFGMLSAGARGETLSELEAGLSLPPQDQLHPAENGLLVALRDRDVEATEEGEGLVLRPVNALFPQTGFDVETPFLDTLGTRYDAGVHLMDFAADPEPARVAINEFVGDSTNDRITNLLPEGSIDPSTRLVLVNALYLKGAWAEPFEAERTSDQTFHAVDGDVEVPFLHGVHNGARYLQTREFELVELPLVGGQIALDVIMGLDDVGGDVSTLSTTLATLGDGPATPVEIALPTWQVRVPMNLIPALQALGVEQLFGAADLSGISTTTDLTVTGAFHQTFFAVDAGGVEAAAATAIVAGETSIPPPPVTVTVDRPFHFILRDTTTNTPLFVGRIANPADRDE